MNRIDLISESLIRLSVQHSIQENTIRVQLPNNFGELEWKQLDEGDDAIQMLDGDFHTHSQMIAIELSTTEVEAFGALVTKILSGEVLLIEETDSNGQSRRTIKDSLDQYVQHLPAGSRYQIFNRT